VLVRGVSIDESTIFQDVIKSTAIALTILLLINAVSLYAAWQAFIRPLEHAAHHLKNNRKVDLTEIASVKMYAKFTSRMLMSVMVSVACVAYIAMRVKAGKVHHTYTSKHAVL